MHPHTKFEIATSNNVGICCGDDFQELQPEELRPGVDNVHLPIMLESERQAVYRERKKEVKVKVT